MQDGKTDVLVPRPFPKARVGKGTGRHRQTDRQDLPTVHANVAESRRPLCTSHSCTRRETEAIRVRVCLHVLQTGVHWLYAINLLACGMVVGSDG